MDEIVKAVRILKPLKMLLGLKDDLQDGLLLFLIDDAISMAKSYCRIKEIPEGMHTTLAAIAADIYRAKGYGSEAAPDVVRSISEGDRSVSYADKAEEKDILANYHRRLKPYINRKGILPSEVSYDE